MVKSNPHSSEVEFKLIKKSDLEKIFEVREKFVNQIQSLRIIEKLSEIYKSQYINDSEYVEQLKKENGYLALLVFVKSYAYERQGRAPAYPKIASECISEYYNNGGSWDIPTEKDAEEIWKKYKDLAKEKYNLVKKGEYNQLISKVNEARNPLNDEGGIIKIIAQEKIKNIALFVLEKYKENETKFVYNFFVKVRGIGPKISSYYLRDIADKGLKKKLLSNENEITDLFLLQPIDTWVDQVTDIIFGEVIKDRVEKQRKIVALCQSAGVSSINFNQGAWILGNQLAGNFGSLKKILKDKNELLDIIKKKVEKLNDYSRILNDIMKEIQFEHA